MHRLKIIADNWAYNPLKKEHILYLVTVIENHMEDDETQKLEDENERLKIEILMHRNKFEKLQTEN